MKRLPHVHPGARTCVPRGCHSQRKPSSPDIGVVRPLGPQKEVTAAATRLPLLLASCQALPEAPHRVLTVISACSESAGLELNQPHCSLAVKT